MHKSIFIVSYSVSVGFVYEDKKYIEIALYASIQHHHYLEILFIYHGRWMKSGWLLVACTNVQQSKAPVVIYDNNKVAITKRW